MNNYFHYIRAGVIQATHVGPIKLEEQKMSRKLSILTVATFSLIPAQLMAGGPPRLCIPIDGVTPATSNRAAN
jgi:hypothetical protein